MIKIDNVKPTVATKPPRLAKRLRKRLILRLAGTYLYVLLAIFGLVLLMSGLIGWRIGQNPPANNNNPKNVIKNVSRLVAVPAGETPSVATVVDRTKIATQPFLAQAQNGDKLLIYTAAKKIIIYRPSINKVVDIGPVSISPSELNNQ